MPYSNDTLLKQIKSRALIPSDQRTFTDEQLLELATDEIQNKIVPMILRTRSEFYVSSKDFQVTDSSRVIDIPYRSIGLALRDVVKVEGKTEHSLPLVSPEDKWNFGFYLRGNKVVVLGGGSAIVRLYFYLRPGDLTLASNAAIVTAIDRDTKTLTITSTPPSWVASSSVDFVKVKPGFDYIATDILLRSADSSLIVLDSIPVGLSKGDWVTLSGTSPVPQIPIEFYPLLAQCVASKVLEGIGDFEGMQACESKIEALEKNALSMISPRVKGEAKKVLGHRRNRQHHRYF